MKKISLICGALLLGAFTFASCSDMLEKEPLDEFTNNPDFWNNESSIEGYAAAFYNQFTGYGTSGSGDFYFPSPSDNQAGATFQNWKYTNIPAANSSWSATYTEIRRSNVMIQSVENYATSLDDVTKNHWLGVARLMRAYQYWDLVRKFGDCVWVDQPLDVNSPELYVARNDRDEVMDKVLEDLDFAVKNINESSSKTTWSRAMAQAMKARICLWEGTFRKYRNEQENGKAPDAAGATRFLEACVEACEAIMPSFSLCGDYQSLYNSIDLSANPEIIFCKAYQKDVMGHSTINYLCTSTEQNGMTKDAFDSYLKLDGTLPVDGVDDVAKLELSANDGQMHLNIKDILDNRDKRLAMQIDTVLCYGNRGWMRLPGGMAMTSSTGYSICKFDNLDMEKDYRENNGKNYTWAPLFWLAEVYLNFAEAKAELGTLSNEDLDKSINLLKDRAGLPHITISPADLGDNDMGVSSLIWEIRRERRCELMFDNDFRYWDLIRWHQLDKLDTTKNPEIVQGANVSNDANISECGRDVVAGNYLDASNGMSRTYEYKHYLFPIPSGQITLNSKLGQNPGWTK